MTEFVNEGINGQVFERGSVEALFTQLNEMVADPEKNLYSLVKTTSFQRGTSDMASETFNLYACLDDKSTLSSDRMTVQVEQLSREDHAS